MARPIDEKIVKMTLENKQFKDGVSETLSSFKAINEGTASLGNTAAFDKMAAGISSIERRFSATGIAIATFVSSLTNSAISIGKNLVSTVMDPLVEGGKKRALNIEQAKFQFEGLGMDIEATMASALAAVKGTAFGLDEAAVVAAQFGASGMKAGDEMTSALTAISGVAAMTGSSYSDIGNIFTSVAGNGRLMGNDLLRLSSRGINAAATLADSMGISEQAVREMVTKGQISFEMFAGAMDEAFGEHATKANETYAGSLSNLRAALARIGAAIYAPGFENKRDMFNALTPVVDNLMEAILPLIDAWTEFNNIKTDAILKFINSIDFSKFVELGGITNLVKAFWNVIKSGIAVLKSIGEGFSRVFSPNLTNIFVRITEAVLRFTESLTVNSERAGKLSRIFEGVFSVFSVVFDIAKQLGGILLSLIPKGLGGTVLDVLVHFADLAVNMRESFEAGNIVTAAIGGLGKVLGGLKDILSTVGGGILDFARGLKVDMGGAFDWVMDKLGGFQQFLTDVFGGIGSKEVLGGGFLLGLYSVIKKVSGVFENLGVTFESFQGLADSISDNISGIFEQLGGALEAFQNQVQYMHLLTVALAIGVLAYSLGQMAGLEMEDIAKGLGALVGAMGTLAAGMAILEKINVTGGIKASVNIVALATAVSIMSSALKKLSGIDENKMSQSIGALVVVTGALAAAVIAISKWGGKIGTTSLQLIALSTAVLILSSAVENMAQIDGKDLAKSVAALGVIFLELAAFLKIVQGAKFGPGSALGILGISAAITVMVGAIEDIAGIDMNGLIKGLGTIGILLLEIGVFTKLTSGASMMSTGAGLVVIAGAINLLVPPIRALGEMSLEQLAKGLGAMAAALTLVTIAAAASSGSMGGALAVAAMAVAMKTLIGPIDYFANMTWGEMIKGFVGIAGAMTLMAAAAILLSPAALPMLGFATGLLAMGAAIALVGTGVALFGAGLVTLATLTATSVAAIVSALALLIDGLITLVPRLVEFGKVMILSMLDGLVQVAPQLFAGAVEIIMKLLNTINDNLTQFINVGVSILIKIIEGLAKHTGPLVDAGMKLMVKFLNDMADTIERNGPALINAFLRVLGEVLIVFVTAGLEVINALFGWIPGVKKATAAIGDTAEETIRANFGAAEVGRKKGEDFGAALGKTSGGAKTAGKKVAEGGRDGAGSVSLKTAGEEAGAGFVSGINAKRGDVSAAAGGLASLARGAIQGVLRMRSPSRALMEDGNFFTEGFAIGIEQSSSKVEKNASEVADTAREAIRRYLDGISDQDFDDPEVVVRAVLDYDEFDPNRFGLPGQTPFSPDTSRLNNLVSITDRGYSQNGNKTPSDSKVGNTSGDTYNYEIKVEAKSGLTRREQRELAKVVQDEIKVTHDSHKLNRGEAVTF